MKKIILLSLILLVTTPLASLAQKQLYFGMAGTFTTTWITNQNIYGQPELNYKLTGGYCVNLNIGFDFNKHIGLKTEVGYALLGQGYDGKQYDTATTRKVRLKYLQIPLLFKYRTSGKTAQFYILAGPQFNILLSAKQDYKRGDVKPPVYHNPEIDKDIDVGAEDIKDRYNSLDIFARIDFGVDISIIENLFLNVGITAAYGLMDINASDWQLKDNSGNYTPSHNIYGGINFGLCYRFNTSKGR
jgi:hypothetical protein